MHHKSWGKMHQIVKSFKLEVHSVPTPWNQPPMQPALRPGCRGCMPRCRQSPADTPRLRSRRQCRESSVRRPRHAPFLLGVVRTLLNQSSFFFKKETHIEERKKVKFPAKTESVLLRGVPSRIHHPKNEPSLRASPFGRAQ